MFDLSSKFNTFYDSCVVLPQVTQNELYDKKRMNLERLNAGLEEYNQENGTVYKVVETCVQGSVIMSTVVQNEDHDYDIDVAVVFDESTLDGKGAQATRNMVADALRRKTKQFNAEPEIKTSCIRVKYSDGYHIDFAVYRRILNEHSYAVSYEHAGAEWNQRDLKGLANWFDQRNKALDDKLRKVVRLSKMFCKSRDFWKNMPSGLIQTVLCDERLQSHYDRIDEFFYYTMKEIVSRLESRINVHAPVDNGRELVTRDIDRQRIINWKNRLQSKLDDLEILFDPDCQKKEAMQAWYGFFNHDFWKQQETSASLQAFAKVAQESVCSYDDTEQFIEDMYPNNIAYKCNISCVISGKGWMSQALESFLDSWRHIPPHGLEIRCTLKNTNTPEPYHIFWKVKNVGPEAERLNEVRGQIKEGGKSIVEHTKFFGNHYIECYIVKDGVCVARKKIQIPIGRR